MKVSISSETDNSMLPIAKNKEVVDNPGLGVWLLYGLVGTFLILLGWFVPIHYYFRIPWSELALPFVASVTWEFASVLSLRWARARWVSCGSVRPLLLVVCGSFFVFSLIIIGTGWRLEYWGFEDAFMMTVASLVTLTAASVAVYYVLKSHNFRGFKHQG
jgi:hypothetical protein